MWTNAVYSQPSIPLSLKDLHGLLLLHHTSVTDQVGRQLITMKSDLGNGTRPPGDIRKRSDSRVADATPLVALRRDGHVVEQSGGSFISDDIPKRKKPRKDRAKQLPKLVPVSTGQPVEVFRSTEKVLQLQPQMPSQTSSSDTKAARCSDKVPVDTDPQALSGQRPTFNSHPRRPILAVLLAPIPENARGAFGSVALVVLAHLAIDVFWTQYDRWRISHIDDVQTLVRHKALWWQIHDGVKFFPLLMAIWLFVALKRHI